MADILTQQWPASVSWTSRKGQECGATYHSGLFVKILSGEIKKKFNEQFNIFFFPVTKAAE